MVRQETKTEFILSLNEWVRRYFARRPGTLNNGMSGDSLGMSRLQIYVYVVLPLAFRVSLPALNNNLVNLVKTTTQAIVIAVPELLYQLVSIYNDYSTSQNACMLLMFVVYITLVGCWCSA